MSCPALPCSAHLLTHHATPHQPSWLLPALPACLPACSNEHTYMCVRLPGLIQGQGQLTRKMVFQPASLQSNLHKQLRAAADKLHVKTQRVRALLCAAVGGEGREICERAACMLGHACMLGSTAGCVAPLAS